MAVDILILGAGWLSTFLTPLCNEHSISYAATTRYGRDSTICFLFDPDSDDLDTYRVLPNAHTILVTFPIIKKGASARLIRLYQESRTGRDEGEAVRTAFIQLGSVGIWDGLRTTRISSTSSPIQHQWYDRHSPFPPSDRASAETELLQLSSAETPTTVLNLAGLWGCQRNMRKWVSKVAPTKEALQNKGSLHMIHGLDVSRAIIAVHSNFSRAAGQRWMLTDGRVYDWWDLASAWGSVPYPPYQTVDVNATTPAYLSLASPSSPTGGTEGATEDHGPHPQWVRELMRGHDVRALPRDVTALGRALDSREFWDVFQLSPVKARMEGW